MWKLPNPQPTSIPSPHRHFCSLTVITGQLRGHVTDLQHRLEAGEPRRQPLAERPTALEIKAAQDMIARFDGFEQLAGAYLFGLPPTSANPDQMREAAPTRLETALAA